ncbi:MAG: RagB/SusD family nutrient uptake outer membrane protein [Bacteroidota bacterium]|nr:RagB/SusD family nutrient uptake outer membrane protein [Bacteroidota bacterium]
MKNKLMIMVYGSFCCSLLFLSCNKIIDVATPQNQLTTRAVFADTTSTTAAMLNVYSLFDKTIDPNYNKWTGLYTDELSYPSSGAPQLEVHHSTLSVTNVYVKNAWANNYFAIYSCNDIITQLQNAKNIPTSMVANLTGEAKFLRAYSYFYLVNTFGNIPLVLTTDINQTAKAAQSDSVSVYRQIIQDLTDAQNSLPSGYSGGIKIRATKWAAIALRSRVYLFQRDWTNAEASATSVINSGNFTPLPSLTSVFLASSQEAILQFGTQNGFITDGPSLIAKSGALPTYPVTTTLLNAFEAGDQRKTNWLNSSTVGGTTYYYPFKYHNRVLNTSSPEYLVALRASEQYLIRAEARAELGNMTGAVQDLNVVRHRAGLPDLSSSLSQSACLTAVMQEWRVEFFTEWAHRFLDLKRTGRLNPVMTAYKPTWLPNAVLWPVPASEIASDSNLKQNLGY